MLKSRGEVSVLGFRFRRPLWVLGGVAAAIVLHVAVLGGLWYRGRSQERGVEKLLAFEVSIDARYRQFDPTPTPTIVGSLVFRGGLHVHGFNVQDDPPAGFAWFVAIFGEHCFARVDEIALFDERFTDAGVPLLLAFPDVTALDVSGTSITDAGLARLATLNRLVQLNVSRTAVTGESLRRLAQCRTLRELDISYTKADAATIEFLKHALPDCVIRD